MAKLADAADLKSAGAKSPVGVRFPLPAPAHAASTQRIRQDRLGFLFGQLAWSARRDSRFYGSVGNASDLAQIFDKRVQLRLAGFFVSCPKNR